MIGKILFTAAVIAVVLLIWRTRNATRVQAQAQPRLVNPVANRRAPLRALALAAVAVMILGSGVLLYGYWADRSDVIFIRVVDATTGRATEYRARRGDIDDREFVTTDGRRIVLAETERLETTTVRPRTTLDQN